MAGVEYQVTKVDPTNPETKGMVYQVNSVTEEVAATMGGKIYRARIIKDPSDPLVVGKVYQIVIIADPTDPSVKGKVYNAILTGGAEAVVVGPAVSPLVLPDAVEDDIVSLKAFGGTEQRSLPQGYQQLVSLTTDDASYFDADYIINSFDVDVTTDAAMTLLANGPNMLWGFMGNNNNLPRWGVGSYQNNWLYSPNMTSSGLAVTLDANRHITVNKMYYSGNTPMYRMIVDDVASSEFGVPNTEIMEGNTLSTFVGARNNSGTAGNFNPSTFYSFKIEKAGELVVNMVPAKRLSDNVVGFYDTVRDRFFINAGTGTITAGNAAVPIPDYPMDIVCNNGVLKARHQSGLPLDCVLVDGVTNTQVGGTNGYIDTGVVADVDDMEFDVVAKWVYSGNASWYVLQSRSGGTQPIYGISGSQTGKTIIGSFSGTNVASPTIIRQQNHTYHVNLKCKNGNMTLFVEDLTDNTSETTTGTYTFTAALTDIGLFSNITGGGTLTVGTTYVKSAYIKKSGVKVMDYMSCTQNTVAGFYDFVATDFVGATAGGMAANPAVSDPTEIYTDGTVETINVHGKNLFDKNNIYKDNYAINASGVEISSTGFCIIKVSVLPSTSYTWSCSNGGYTLRIHAYDKNGNWISQLSAASTSQTTTVTTTSNTYEVRFSINKSTDNLNNGQFELGSTATDYQPYFDGGTATCEDLLSVGDYTDEQEVISGAVTRKVGVLVLDGTENWTWNASSGWRARLNISTVETTTSSMPALLCNMFAAASWSGVSATTPLISINSTGTTINFTVGWDANITTLTQWTTWLATQYAAGTPVIVVYPLATETTETVTGQPMSTTAGDNTAEITQASMSGLEIECTYMKEGA